MTCPDSASREDASAEERFKKLKEGFKQDFGIDFPPELEPAEGTGLAADPNYPLVYSREVVSSKTHLLPSNFGDLPDGVWMAGYWGYGTNSYAFYYVRKDPARNVFLRLPYGGAYGDAAEDGARVREFLLRYIAFEKWARENLLRWTVQVDMGSCRIRLTGSDSRTAELEGAFCEVRFPNEP